LKYRRFGKTGWNVSEIGYGMWGVGGWTGSNDTESLNSIQHSIDLGCNFFDTAYAYGEGHSEKILAKSLQANLDKRLYAATKIPPKNRIWPSKRQFKLDDCFPPEYIEEYVQKSLKNLAVKKIDLIQFHTWEDSWLDDTRLVHKIEELKSRGLIVAIGISINRWETWNGIKAVNSGLIDAVQVIYNIFDQNPEDELFPACRKMDVGVIARVPFDEGSLTGALTRDSKWPRGDWRNTYFTKENLLPTLERVEKLNALVPKGMTLPEMAMKFILANPDVSTVIPGMRKIHHVEQNISSSGGSPLPKDLLKELRKFRWDRVPTSWSD
jgi:aryl-alcohol dehydrogenase-like predicted oxidoreductase